MSEVFVVTNTELGWDCVVGVFRCSEVTREQLKEVFKGNTYIIQKYTIQNSLIDYE